MALAARLAMRKAPRRNEPRDPAPIRRRAVFVDKDGTLIENVPYNVAADRISLRSGAADGLRRLHALGYTIVVVSNQSGVARGYFGEDDLLGVRERIRVLMEEASIPPAAFYYCPHHPEGTVSAYSYRCDCRKPEPGLLVRAASDLGLDLASSWMVGDILDDVEAGRRAGCRTVLVEGGEDRWTMNPHRMPHRIVSDLAEAAEWIERLDGWPAPPPERVEAR